MSNTKYSLVNIALLTSLYLRNLLYTGTRIYVPTASLINPSNYPLQPVVAACVINNYLFPPFYPHSKRVSQNTEITQLYQYRIVNDTVEIVSLVVYIYIHILCVDRCNCNCFIYVCMLYLLFSSHLNSLRCVYADTLLT